jgi:peptidoglycan/xylan/chitin deacetylase (PgdA/CDA1 family)
MPQLKTFLRRPFLSVAALVAAAGASVLSGLTPARAQNCPGNPDAIGTSRVIVVRPGEYTQLGVMQYHQSLPLADKEVVLTFDDGPLPPYSNQILDILASQCVKATYFMVGSMARAFPATARRIYEAGNAVGTHSEDHPPRFQKLPVDKIRQEIDEGIADVGAALGDPKDVAPFFRIPGLARTDAIEDELTARALVVFSSDTVADDWFRHIRPADIISRAMSRLERRGRGILLLHDIHKKTALALPGLLKELKDHGFHIVQVVAGAPVEPSTPETWMMASGMPDDGIIAASATEPRWPPSSAVVAAQDVVMPAPDTAAFDIGNPDDPAGSLAADSAGNEASWPHDPAEPTLPASAAELPVPGMQDIGVPTQGQRIVGATDETPGTDVRPPAEHGRLRHERFHTHRRATAPAVHDSQHADMFAGLRAFAALISTPR